MTTHSHSHSTYSKHLTEHGTQQSYTHCYNIHHCTLPKSYTLSSPTEQFSSSMTITHQQLLSHRHRAFHRVHPYLHYYSTSYFPQHHTYKPTAYKHTITRMTPFTYPQHLHPNKHGTNFNHISQHSSHGAITTD